MQLIADLGVEWEKLTQLPLPLGAIVVSRNLDSATQQKVDRVLRRSVAYAMAHPAASADFVHQYAQELDEEVTRSHIELFVNNYSIDLGAEGRKAVTQLLDIDKEKEEELFV